MALIIKEINTIHYIKGVYQKTQKREVKCYILDKLQNENSVKVDLSELEDQNHEIIYMLQRVKSILTNRNQLQYFKLAA